MIRRLAAALLVRLAKRKPGLPPYCFHDQHGRAYYAWQRVADLPALRIAEVEGIMLQIDAGLDRKELKQIGDAIAAEIDAAAEAKDAKQRRDHLTRGRFLINELLTRPSRIVPEGAFYALAATCCVRADEDPITIDRFTHQEKIETFRRAAQAKHAFFLRSPTFAALLGSSLSTEGALLDLLVEWARRKTRTEAVTKIASSTTD